MIRTEAQLTVSRFCELIGLSRRAYYARRDRHLAGPAAKGPWPSPAVDAVAAAVERTVSARPDWGHRTVWVQLRDEGVADVSAATVRRAMARRRAGAQHVPDVDVPDAAENLLQVAAPPADDASMRITHRADGARPGLAGARAGADREDHAACR